MYNIIGTKNMHINICLQNIWALNSAYNNQFTYWRITMSFPHTVSLIIGVKEGPAVLSLILLSFDQEVHTGDRLDHLTGKCCSACTVGGS